MPRSLATASARDDEPGFAALSLGVKIESHRIREINILGKAASEFLWQAFVDLDGTLGECKGGMAVSYKGISGYAPLIITLANTREVLYLVNRPGNAVSHEGFVLWIDRAIELLRSRAGEITQRRDTDFTLSAELDRWDSQGRLQCGLFCARCLLCSVPIVSFETDVLQSVSEQDERRCRA